MRLICLLVAMSMMSSVSGDTCESLWAEEEAEIAAGRHVDIVRRQAQIKCGYRPAFPDVGNMAFRDDDDSGKLNKMLGGSFARPGEFPWQVNIYVVPPHMICGGVILNDFWVLTIAECMSNVTSVNQVKVAFGMYDIDRGDDLSRVSPIEKIIIHQLYDPNWGFDYDIALIKVCSRGPIPFNEHIQPICLPEPGAVVPTGTELTLSGYGQDNDMYWNVPTNLRKVVLPVIDHTICSNLYPGMISDRMLCAGYIDGDINACYGDKGGPAVYKSGDVYVLAGIMAAGVGCAPPSSPVVFSSVIAYRTWIADVLSRDNNLGEIEISWI